MFSLIGYSFWIHERIEVCSSDDFFGGTKDGIIEGWILVVLLGSSDGLVLDYDEIIILLSTNG